VYEPLGPGKLVRIEPLREGQEITVAGDILMWLYKDLEEA
jgi:hypothetical protein